jgi:hypothetical protein
MELKKLCRSGLVASAALVAALSLTGCLSQDVGFGVAANSSGQKTDEGGPEVFDCNTIAGSLSLDCRGDGGGEITCEPRQLANRTVVCEPGLEACSAIAYEDGRSPCNEGQSGNATLAKEGDDQLCAIACNMIATPNGELDFSRCIYKRCQDNF